MQLFVVMSSSSDPAPSSQLCLSRSWRFLNAGGKRLFPQQTPWNYYVMIISHGSAMKHPISIYITFKMLPYSIFQWCFWIDHHDQLWSWAACREAVSWQPTSIVPRTRASHTDSYNFIHLVVIENTSDHHLHHNDRYGGLQSAKKNKSLTKPAGWAEEKAGPGTASKALDHLGSENATSAR